jgi:hypothetical protein
MNRLIIWRRNIAKANGGFFIGSGTDLLLEGNRVDENSNSGEHPLEVVLSVIKTLERHTCLDILVLRVLARLALDLAWSSVERPDLLTAPVWMAGRVEQSAAQNVANLMRNKSARDTQPRMLSTECLQHQNLVAESCGDVQCLLQFPGATEDEATQALQGLSVIKQVHMDLIEYTQNVPTSEYNPAEARACNAFAKMSMPGSRFEMGKNVSKSVSHMASSRFAREVTNEAPGLDAAARGMARSITNAASASYEAPNGFARSVTNEAHIPVQSRLARAVTMEAQNILGPSGFARSETMDPRSSLSI